MSTILPNMLLELPVRGAPGSGLWADDSDENWQRLDAHDHSSGKGLPVGVAGLSIDGDLSFGSLYAPTNLQRITFASIAALASNNKSLFVSDGSGGLTNGELYWRSNAGNNVRLTSGSALNVAAFTGGIGGDYVSTSASLSYDSSATRYTLRQGGGIWARMASGEVRILETGTSETVYVGFAAPSGLASSYTMTWPLALPASGTRPLALSSSGVISTGGTYVFSVIGAALAGGAAVSNGQYISLGTATTDAVSIDVAIPDGLTITAWSVTIKKTTNATKTVSVALQRTSAASEVPTDLGTASNSANAPGVVDVGESSVSYALPAGSVPIIIVSGSGTSGDLVISCKMTLA